MSLIDGCKKHYRGYSKLSIKEQNARVKTLSNELLHVVVNRKRLKEDGMEYIKGNEDLAVYVCTLLDHILRRA